MAKNIKDYKVIYHLTNLKNLDSILEKGLLCRAELSRNVFFNIADEDMINSRSEKKLENYVPFHFFPRNPFDGIIFSRYVNEDFIYICVLKETAKNNRYKILPKHPMAMRSEFCLYEFDEGIKKIDWDLMNKRDYKDEGCKMVCMAECISEKSVSSNDFNCIFVKNEYIKKIVESKIKKLNKNINILVNSSFFPK